MLSRLTRERLGDGNYQRTEEQLYGQEMKPEGDDQQHPEEIDKQEGKQTKGKEDNGKNKKDQQLQEEIEKAIKGL